MTLTEFVTALQAEPTEPLPAAEDWLELIERISQPNRNQEVNQTEYYYFLEVLPPKYQWNSLFAFAEGAEPLRLFWRKQDHFFCRQLTWTETETFCRLARMPLPN